MVILAVFAVMTVFAVIAVAVLAVAVRAVAILAVAGGCLFCIIQHKTQKLAFVIRQARTEALFYGLLAFAHSTAAVLRGAGRPMIPMAIMLGIWCILRIGYITLMVWLFQDITVVFTAYPVTWGLSCLLFAYFLKHQDQLYRQIKQL